MVERSLCGAGRLPAAVVALAFALAVAALPSGAATVKRGDFAKDLFVAGATVEVDATVAGDVIAGGGQVVIAAEAGGDVVAAGGTVDVAGTVGHNLLAAGGLLSIEAAIGGKVLATGGRVRLRRAARVDGDAVLSGGTVEIAGTVGGDVRVAAGRVLVLGRIDGDLEASAGALEVAAGARVGGRVVHRGPDPPVISADAAVAGEVVHRPAPFVAEAAALERRGPWAGLVLVLGAIVLGLALHLALPGFTAAATRELADRPWRSLVGGFALLALTPFAAALLFASVLGAPLALAGLAAWFLLLLAGPALVGFALAEAAGRRWWPEGAGRGAALLALYSGAMALLGLLAWLPFLGVLVLVLTPCFGAGAALSVLLHAGRRPSGTV